MYKCSFGSQLPSSNTTLKHLKSAKRLRNAEVEKSPDNWKTGGTFMDEFHAWKPCFFLLGGE